LARAREQLAVNEGAGGHGLIVAARRAALRAGIAALEGRQTEALALYRDALRGWRTTGVVWDETLTGIDMAQLLDPTEPEVAEIIESTRATLERLGAKPYIERLEAALAASVPAKKATAARQTPAEVQTA
jgi:hypothetical protein